MDVVTWTAAWMATDWATRAAGLDPIRDAVQLATRAVAVMATQEAAWRATRTSMGPLARDAADLAISIAIGAQ